MLSRCLRAALVSNGRRSFSSEAAMEVVQMVDDTAITTTTTSTTSISSSGKEEEGGGGGGGGRDTLGRRLMSLIYPKRSAVIAIRKWSEEGRTVQKYELNRIVRELRKLKRYKHALEVCEWMKTQPHIKLLPGDYALHLDMVAKVRGLASAEKFFEDLPEEMRGEATYSALLHTYVQHKSSVKAEALMNKMLECGHVKNILPYNHMLSLYISTGQLEKVPVVIQQLKKNTTPDVVTYNMWLTVCASENDVESAEKAFRELKRAKLIADWVTYSILTSLYIKNNLLEQAKASLVDMEKRVGRKNRVAFSSLITLNANMNDKNGVRRIWRRINATYRKMNDAEYTCMISSLLKLEELEEAETVYKEWESVSGTGDSRLPNLLLTAYINKVSMEKAEEFLDHMVQKSISPSYTTFELLTWGYLKLGDIEKAMDHFKRAIGSVRNWIVEEKIVREIYRLLEKKGDIQTAEELLVILRKAGYVTTEIYNSLLRTYEKAGRMPLIVAERMMKDKVKLDEETHQLLKVTSKLCVGDISSIMS